MKVVIENFKTEELESRFEFKQWIKFPEPCGCADCDCRTETTSYL